MQGLPNHGTCPEAAHTPRAVPARPGRPRHKAPAVILVLGLISALLMVAAVSRSVHAERGWAAGAFLAEPLGAHPPDARFAEVRPLQTVAVASVVVAQWEPVPRAPATMTVATSGSSTFQDAVMSVAPSTPWLSLPPSTAFTRIGFGSCLDQRYPQPIWTSVLKAKPQLFMMIGDNVYGDIKSPDAKELVEAYRKQLAHPEFSEARSSLPMIGIWDDHDYGLNDGTASFQQREASAALFRSYWQAPVAKDTSAGVNTAHIYGPDGKRVQIILLDVRSFRSAFGPKPAGSNLAGKFGPDWDTQKTMLGAEQWSWLEGELRKPADIRLLVSSIQVLSEGHAFERWGNLPLERDRLLKLIETTGAKGVLLLSGDRHLGAIYKWPLAASQIVFEMTSSSLNRSYGPAKDMRTPELISNLHHAENFGLIDIDWSARKVALTLKGMSGDDLDVVAVGFADLGLGQ